MIAGGGVPRACRRARQDSRGVHLVLAQRQLVTGGRPGDEVGVHLGPGTGHQDLQCLERVLRSALRPESLHQPHGAAARAQVIGEQRDQPPQPGPGDLLASVGRPGQQGQLDGHDTRLSSRGLLPGARGGCDRSVQGRLLEPDDLGRAIATLVDDAFAAAGDGRSWSLQLAGREVWLVDAQQPGDRPVRCSRRSIAATARRPALTSSQRTGSGAQCGERCPTQGSRISSVSRPSTRSASVRPARFVAATPSPTYPPAWPIRVAGSKPTEAYQSRGTPSGPPQVWLISWSTSANAGKSSVSARASSAKTAGSRSYSGKIFEPKWYGAPRPPNASRSSAVR